MELSGGLILPEVDEWMRSFIPDLEGDPEQLNEKVPLGTAGEAERQLKYSYEKLNKMFLLYRKCTDGGEDTVVKALCENYFMRAYRSYKFPLFAHKTFDSNPLTVSRVAHNDEIIASFGEGNTRLCVVSLSDNDRLSELEKLPSILIEREKNIETLQEELSLERSAKAAILTEQEVTKAFEMDEYKTKIQKEFEIKLEEYELAIAEGRERASRENEELKRGLAEHQALVERNAAQARIIDALTNDLRAAQTESRRFKGELDRSVAQSNSSERDARAEIARLRSELEKVASSATEKVSQLQVQNAELLERITNRDQKVDDLRAQVVALMAALEKGREKLDTLTRLIPSQHFDQANKNCSIS